MKNVVIIFSSILCLGLSTFASEEVAATTEVIAEKSVDKSEATVLTVAKTEDQIPLNIDQVKKTSDATPMSARMMMTGIIISALLGSVYYFVKKYKSSNTINKSNMQIKVLSQHYLGPKKSLAIVRVAGESILIGITDSNVSMIKSLALLDDEVPNEVPANFNEAMAAEKTKSALPKMKMQNTATMNTMVGVDELEEEFSFSGLKDTVSKKLKSMRSI
ncbi:MAG: flagellar biosynthetic protein FliO [Pseudobdellovibrio sp.]